MDVLRQVDKIIVTLDGRLDSNQSELIRNDFLTLAEAGKDIDIDMGRVDIVDSSGLGLLVSLRKRTSVNNKEVVLLNLKEQPAKVFKLSRLDKTFIIK